MNHILSRVRALVTQELHPDAVRISAAGRRAKQMLRDGLPEAEVAAVLDNWLPSSSWEN